MIRSLGGRLLLALVALAVVGVWTQRDNLPELKERVSDLFQRNELISAPGGASEELARRAERKLQALLNGSSDATVSFGGDEVQSYVEYRLAGSLPAGVSDPQVKMGDSTLALRVQIELEELQDLESVDALRTLLGDSTSIEAEFEPELASPGVGQVQVLSLRAGAFPIPALAIPMVLRQAGLKTRGGTSRAVVFPVTANVTSIAVRNGTLEVTAEPGGE